MATAIMNILLSIFMVDKYGLVGAAGATAITLFIGELLGVGIYLSRVIKLEMLRFYAQGLGFIIPALIAVMGLGSYIEPYYSDDWLGLILGVSTLLIFYIVVVYFLVINSSERALVQQLFNRKKV